MVKNKISLDFYQHNDVLEISRALIGKVLVSKINGAITSGMIIETEAYRAPEDKASHAYGNRRTQRTDTMFAAGGVAYVYLCYGIHSLFNIVTGPEDVPHAVLIRALTPLEGLEHMLLRRRQIANNAKLTAGPGTLSTALGITTKHDKASLIGDTIWLEDHGFNFAAHEIITTPRIGIAYAQEYAAMPWRFVLNLKSN